jgi:hypothetical protein
MVIASFRKLNVSKINFFRQLQKELTAPNFFIKNPNLSDKSTLVKSY